MNRTESRSKTVRRKRSGSLIGGHCLIFGGGGYIGRSFAQYAINHKLFESVTLADIAPKPRGFNIPGIDFRACDVRHSIEEQLGDVRADWIINAAAIHREPGHTRAEYFDTNVRGAENVCAYAAINEIPNILFTSSVAVYGPTSGPTDERQPCHPDTAYGASKLVAEKVHLGWCQAATRRRLITVRPGVVYGPGDTANMLRLIHSLQLGIFVLPGSPQIRKSYAYIEGLCDAFAFMMRRSDSTITSNYVEVETLPLIKVIAAIQKEFGLHRPVPRIPSRPLEWIAAGLQWVTIGNSPIHPDRVRKVSRPTYIVPGWLAEQEFTFRFGFEKSLADWRQRSPLDFLPSTITLPRYAQMRGAAILEKMFQ